MMSLIARAVLMLALVCAPAIAQSTDGHPDFSGFWAWDGTPHPAEIKAAKKGQPRDVVFLTDSGAVEFGPGKFGGLEPKPEVLKAALAWTPKEELKPENLCRKPSIVYSMQGPFPLEIYQGTELIVLKLEYFDIVRTVFIGGSPRPEDAPHSLEGYSVGRWEGNTLIVDTTYLESATITNNGLEHSDAARVEERFWLNEDGSTLFATQLFADPQNLKNRGLRLLSWRREPGQFVFPYECNPFAYTR